MTNLSLLPDGWTSCTCDMGGSAGCLVHDAGADDTQREDDNVTAKVWTYQCLILNEGALSTEELDGTSTSHAYEEAGYEFEGRCIAVRRGGYMYPA
jgi:hypothetical protein